MRNETIGKETVYWLTDCCYAGGVDALCKHIYRMFPAAEIIATWETLRMLPEPSISIQWRVRNPYRTK